MTQTWWWHRGLSGECWLLMMRDNCWMTSEIPSRHIPGCSPLSTQDRSPHVSDISSVTTHHRPHRPVPGPEPLPDTSIHPTLALLCAQCVPWSSWVSFIIPRVTTHRLDKYLLDVFLSWLWSLMPLTLLSPDSWELSLHLWIVGDRKSHFIHDNVPDWRLLIKRRLVPLNQTSEECSGLGLGQAQTRIKFLKQIFCFNIIWNSLAQPSVASVAWMNKIWQLQPGPAGLAIVNSFYGLCCNNRSVL